MAASEVFMAASEVFEATSEVFMAASEVFEAASAVFMAASAVFETQSEVFKPLSNEYIYNPSLRSQSAPLRAEIPDQVRDDEYKHTYMQQTYQ